MADVLIKCPDCGKECKVSQYAAPGSVVCPACGHPLELPSDAGEKAGKRLEVRRIKQTTRGDTLTGDKSVYAKTNKAVSAEAVDASREVLKNVHKSRGPQAKNPKAVWSYVSFVLFTMILVGFQYLLKHNPGYYQYYWITRDAICVLVYISVLIVAYDDGIGQGTLCLLIVPYALYYVFVRMESYFLRGAFAACCLALCTELYFMPVNALFTVWQVNLNDFIINVGGLIDKASAPPPKVY